MPRVILENTTAELDVNRGTRKVGQRGICSRSKITVGNLSSTRGKVCRDDVASRFVLRAHVSYPTSCRVMPSENISRDGDSTRHDRKRGRPFPPENARSLGRASAAHNGNRWAVRLSENFVMRDAVMYYGCNPKRRPRRKR